MTSRVRFAREKLPSPMGFYAVRHALKLRGSGTWRSALCPFHGDTRPSLRVNVETGAYWCPVCGAKGDILCFHMTMLGIDFRAAIEDLGAVEEVCR